MPCMSKISSHDVSKAPESKAEFNPGSSNGLQRPRYFCGQLLTEEDLYAEQRYQMEKNRLYNRYLHGWGVVCGLRVTCHRKCSSKGNVLIEKGYALDSCGNDIIVPEDIELNVMELIKECEPKTAEEECLPTGTTKPDTCEGQEKEYCLVINYKEEEARPVTALKRDDEGCSVKRCEPSRIRETYTFEVSRCKECYKTSDDAAGLLTSLFSQTETDRWKDTYVGNVRDCLVMYQEMSKFIGVINLAKEIDPKNHDSNVAAYCRLKEYVRAKIDENAALVHCEVKKIVDEIEFPDQKATDYVQQAQQAFITLYSVLFQMFTDCLCLNLQNPCPTCIKDDKVVLARITVRGNSVTEICNLCRRNVISFPTLFYWLPFDRIIRELIQRVCCEFDMWDVLLRTMMAAQMSSQASKNVMAGFTGAFKRREGVFPEQVYRQKADLAETELAKSNIKVERTIQVDEVTDLGQNVEILKNVLFNPFAMKPGAKVDLYVNKDNEVIYAMPRKVDIGAGVDAVRVLSKEIENMKADLQSMRAAMSFARRDYESTVKFKANIDDPLTIELGKAFTEEMTPEVLKDIGDIRNEEFKRAGIDSVYKLFGEAAANVSNATKEPDATAVKYINYAEIKILEVAKTTSTELKRAKVTDKKDLNKVDSKALAKKLKLSERTVRKVISDIRRVK